MHFASDMMNLRREIDDWHAARETMINGLRQFRAHLRRSAAGKMAQMRKALAEECARSQAARHAFITQNRSTIGEMMAALGAERSAACRNFSGNKA